MDVRDSTDRFSDRVEDYAKNRPSYPPALIECIAQDLGVAQGATVADVGSGTGIFTSMLLDAGYRVIAIEPNAPMREYAERQLGNREGFRSIDARAEQTTLDDASIDLITVAQAFHWFDVAGARAEFARILRQGAQVALIWNDRRVVDSAFGREYQLLIEDHDVDLAVVDHRRVARNAGIVDQLFGSSGYVKRSFVNSKKFDFDGLRGLLRSTSYVPTERDPRYDEMISRLDALFSDHQNDGLVQIDYDTRFYYGTIGVLA